MANFRKGPQNIVINDETDFPFLYFISTVKGYNLIETGDVFTIGTPDVLVTEGTTYAPDVDGVMADPDAGGAGTAIVIADVDRLTITGFATFDRGTVTYASKTRGVAGQKQIATVTYVVTTATAGQEIFLPLWVESENTEAEMASASAYLSPFKRIRYFSVVVETSDTATLIAAKMAAALNAEAYKQGTSFTATASAGVVTITGPNNGTRFGISTDNVSGSGYGNAISSGNISQVLAVTQSNFLGRGTYEQLKTLRLQTEANIYPFSPDLAQQPLKSALYSCHRITKTVNRPDLGGGDGINVQANGGVFQYVIYVNEAATATLAKLVAFFNSVATVKADYPGTAVATVIASETVGTTLT